MEKGCKYCKENSQEYIKAFPNRKLYVITEDGENKIAIAVENECIGLFNIDYCPMCGKNLKGDTNNG